MAMEFTDPRTFELSFKVRVNGVIQPTTLKSIDKEHECGNCGCSSYTVGRTKGVITLACTQCGNMYQIFVEPIPVKKV